jgi:hypothetical protein
VDSILFKIIYFLVVVVAYYKVYLEFKGFGKINKKLLMLATGLLIANILWILE